MIIYVDDWIEPQLRDIQSPTYNELCDLQITESVKICNGRERFFVKITEIDYQQEIVIGTVDNKLVLEAPYNYGSYVEFEFKHIYVIHKREYLDKKSEDLFLAAAYARFCGMSKDEFINKMSEFRLVQDNEPSLP